MEFGMNKKDIKKYHEEIIKKLEKQIQDAEEDPKYSSINTDDLTQEQKSSKILEQLREFNYDQLEIKEPSKSSKLKNLKIKYPYVPSPHNPYRDRDQFKQYWPLVSTKNLKTAEFVLKWEHEHEKRIHKDMAWEILTEIKKNGDVSDEFLENIHKKFENYD
jgi:hypothetical protein